jgi:hypothetical protein
MAMTANQTRPSFINGLILAAVAIPTILVGLADVGTARGLGPRLFGGYLVAVGLLTAAVFLGRRRPSWLAWSALGAGILIMLTGGIGLVITIADRLQYGYGDVRRTAFDLAALAVGLWMIWTSRDYIPNALPKWLDPIGRPGKTRLDNLKTSVELLGLVGIAAAATAFWYTNMYLPSTAQPTVNVTVELAPSTELSPRDVHAQISIRNKSAFRVRIIASEYEVVAQGLGAFDATRAACVLGATARGMPLDADSIWATELGRESSVLAGSGEIIAPGSWLEPGEVLSIGFVTPVPPPADSNRRVIRARASVHVVRGDLVGTDLEWSFPASPPATWPRDVAADDPAAGCAAPETRLHVGSTIWSTSEESVFNMLTRDKVEIETDWWATSQGSVRAIPSLLHDGHQVEGMGPEADQATRSKAYERIVRLYGLVDTETVDELAIGP